MSRLLYTCLALILTNSLIARADFLDNGGFAPRIQTSNWTALYAGATELDGIKVIAALEKSEREIAVPDFNTDRLQTLVPLASSKETSFRLSLVAQDQTNLRVSFPLQARTLSINGRPVLSYFSKNRPGDQFEFAVTPRPDGTLGVQYRRLETETGEFALSPLPQIF